MWPAFRSTPTPSRLAGITALVLLLASADAAFVTGADYLADGSASAGVALAPPASTVWPPPHAAKKV